jgi:hypothetical protein
MARLIIADVHEKIANVLTDVSADVGTGATFTAGEIIRRYAAKFPGDRDYMEERRRTNPKAHSLPGYLDGMLSEYSRLGSPPGPRIQHLGPLEYKLL